MASGTGSGPIHEANPVTDDVARAQGDLDKMREYFAAMPKETIRIPQDRGSQFVQVNGYSFNIAAGVHVQVPKQIAQILRDAQVI